MFEVIHILYRAFFNFCFFSSDIFRISLVCIFQSILYSHSRILLIFFLCFFLVMGQHILEKLWSWSFPKISLFITAEKRGGQAGALFHALFFLFFCDSCALSNRAKFNLTFSFLPAIWSKIILTVHMWFFQLLLVLKPPWFLPNSSLRHFDHFSIYHGFFNYFWRGYLTWMPWMMIIF